MTNFQRTFLAFSLCAAVPALAQNKPLTEVYRNADFQMTGITISKTNRLFINFPRWSDHYENAVVEILPNGSTRPYPDETWNRWDGKPATAGKAFVCVQSVVVDDNDSLWILDPAGPMTGPVVAGGPKLVQVNLQTNQVTRVIPFGSDIAPVDSYLNDIRFDNQRNVAYITDSGHPGLVIVDIASGKAHRALDGHPSVMAQPSVDIAINGKPVRDQNGKQPMFNADSIALSPDKAYLYYQPLTAATLYRIKTSVLRDSAASAASAVETVAQTFPTDGMWMDKQGNLYLSNITKNTITRRTPDGKMENVATDNRLQWPDTFTQGQDGTLYVTASHIHETPKYNHGKLALSSPFSVYKLKP